MAETATNVPSAELAFCRRHPFGRPVLGLAAFLIFISIPGLASAQDISVNFGDSTTLTQRAIQLIALMTVLSLAPSILVMVTSFTRIIVVLSLLRTAIGLQTAPPNSVMVSLALFLTAFIMAPTLQQSYDQGIAPLMAGQIQVNEAFNRSAAPIHTFTPAGSWRSEEGSPQTESPSLAGSIPREPTPEPVRQTGKQVRFSEGHETREAPAYEGPCGGPGNGSEPTIWSRGCARRWARTS